MAVDIIEQKQIDESVDSKNSIVASEKRIQLVANTATQSTNALLADFLEYINKRGNHG